MKKIRLLFSSMVHLFYPNLCAGCNTETASDEHLLCLSCINGLPHTHFAQFPQNPVDKIFYGRIPVVAAHSEFYFSKDSVIQHLIHLLKYKNKPEVGVYLGRLIGKSLLQSERFGKLDLIIPLPLNEARERKRGYNQAAVIADGISEVLQVAVMKQVLVRTRHTETQTKKSRLERWKNVNEGFRVQQADALAGKKLLLVDDVLTTGATLEACARMLMCIDGVQVYIATVAYASKLH